MFLRPLPKNILSRFPRAFSSFQSTKTVAPKNPKTSLIFTTPDTPGALQAALNVFAKHSINLTKLESKPCQRSREYEFHVAFDGDSSDAAIKNMLQNLETVASGVTITESKVVPWFPKSRADLDLIANEILDAGVELESDHPGFGDEVYRKNRAARAQIALDYRYGQSIPRINYSAEEIECWSIVYKQLKQLHLAHACEEHNRLIPLFERHCGYGEGQIPQLQDVNDFLNKCTGFNVRPVAGLLSTRNFLYGLAHRTFFSTQYLRHHSKPLYTPEPDVVHELLGHVPLFADQHFADFSQQIGLASLGASDAQVEQLGRCYWFTVEFGLVKQQDTLKAYGAGLLSSLGELQYSVGLDSTAKPQILPFDPKVAAQTTYPITTYQPLYFVAESFNTMKHQMLEFSQSLVKPFNVRYNLYTQQVEVDNNVECAEYTFIKPENNPYKQEQIKQ